jgi:hypothetical protein
MLASFEELGEGVLQASNRNLALKPLQIELSYEKPSRKLVRGSKYQGK